MTKRGSPLAGWTSIGRSAVGGGARALVLKLLLRPTAPPLAVGIVVGAVAIALETLLVVLLKQIDGAQSFGTIYLLGVLVVSSLWGLGLSVAVSVASTLAFAYFRNWPAGGFALFSLQNGVAAAVFLVVALCTNFVAGLARAHATEADQRRRESHLAAELARVILGAADLRGALDTAADHLARALGLRFAALELGAVASDTNRTALPLCDGANRLGTLLVPADLPDPSLRRIRARVAPPLEEMLREGLEREAINSDLEASREELARFFQLSSDLLCISDPQHVIRVNPALQQLLGYSLDQLVSRPYLELVVPEDRDRARETLERLPISADPVSVENRVICSDGSRRWIEWSVVWRRGLSYAVGRDVTERRGEQAQLRRAQAAVEASRDRLSVLAEQQAALRRVATLVARGASPSEVFSAVTDELARVLHVVNAGLLRYEPDDTGLVVAVQYEPGIAKMPATGERIPLVGDDVGARVLHTGLPARIDNHAKVSGPEAARIRAAAIGSIVGVPVVVTGRLWGAAIVGSVGPDPMPPDTEERICDFADLVATAIANAATRSELQDSRDELAVLAEQQAALRRVATLVARGAMPSEVFSAVADELAGWLHSANATVTRFDDDGTLVILALGRLDPRLKNIPLIGQRLSMEGDNLAVRVLDSGHAARMDSHENAPGPVSAQIRAMGLRGTVGAPIVVNGRVWGMVALGSQGPEPLPPDTELRIADFADLVATAVANAAARTDLQASRDSLSVLVTQQSALRAVATLVARGVSPSELFSAVAEEMARCLNVDNAEVFCYEDDGAAVVLASYAEAGEPHLSVGELVTLEGDNVAARVLRTSGAARMDDYATATGSLAERLRVMGVQCRVGAPIVVDGRVWGTAVVGTSQPEPLPLDTEGRIGDFADLVATAIANAATRAELQASRDELAALADQQAALRRVATLVARGVSPSEVFSTVADEMARFLDVGHAAVYRYDADDTLVPLAIYHHGGQKLPKGLRLTLAADNVAATVLRTGRTARIDRHDDAPGPHAGRIRGLGIHSAVGVPIVIDGRVWGAAVVGSLRPEPLSPDTEVRIADFADLVATAIANAATGAELIASRARIVAAADEARRRLERDLHDGAQQRLVSLGLQLRMAEDSMPPELQDHRRQLSEILSGVAAVSRDLQEISRGIHPAILSKGGLSPALKTLARRCAVPVNLDLTIDRRFADPVEVATYYVVAEALTNAAKHAQASEVSVSARTDDDNLYLSIRDDGVGGADARKGSGLIGLKDRIEALGGHIEVVSPQGSGTSLGITIPAHTP
ncbi:MAG: domain S-box [Mycobacterium sp.]|nr:domain S-box [Mycobacterium sp.]